MADTETISSYFSHSLTDLKDRELSSQLQIGWSIRWGSPPANPLRSLHGSKGHRKVLWVTHSKG